MRFSVFVCVLSVFGIGVSAGVLGTDFALTSDGSHSAVKASAEKFGTRAVKGDRLMARRLDVLPHKHAPLIPAITGKYVAVQRDAIGMFNVDVTLNGLLTRRYLIDTGATNVSASFADAKALGIQINPYNIQG